jgi:hypothetical protein
MQDIAQPAQGWNGEERRKEARKKKPFFIAYTLNEIVYVPAYGLDVSKQGIRILTDVKMPEELRLRIMFKERDFIVGVRKLWEQETPREDKVWQMAGLRYIVIGQNDREFIEAYVAGKAYYEGNKLVEMLEELRKHPEKADEILPREVLERFHRHLASRNRLVLREKESPLVKYHYEGPRQRNGKRVHLMTIQSKVSDGGDTRVFITKFVFNDNATAIEVIG